MNSGLKAGKAGRWLAVALTVCGVLRAAPAGRDTLVFKDGDRVQGWVVDSSGEQIVFKSDRFGELRVPARDASVIRGESPPPVAAVSPRPVVPEPAKPAVHRHDPEDEPSLWDRFSPAALTARVRDFFGPWHGRLSVSSEVVTDAAQRSNSSYEAQLRRKWTADEVQLTGRFDYAQTNDVTTTDLLKASGLWRHEFSRQLFAHYRPTGEWNRESRLRGVPNDYVLLQQEIGIGYQFPTSPGQKLRVGVSENRFDTWNSAPGTDHLSRRVVSVFEETEISLPWRMRVAQRGVWYPVRDQADGWENRVDLTKRLSETFSTSLRHEIRRDNPDGTAQDYTRLKLLFGLDF